MSQESDDETFPLLKQQPETTTKKKETPSESQATEPTSTQAFPLLKKQPEATTSKKEEKPSDNQAKEPTPTHSEQPAITETKPKEISSKKVSKPTFLDREIIVENYKDVESKTALESMQKTFQKEYARWKKRTGVFKLANLIVTVVVIAVQVTQVIIFQIPSTPTNTKQALATILPAITGAVLAIQLKLGWAEKSQKCKKAAKLYSTLGRHVNYRIEVAEAGGITEDTVKLLNTALLSINKEVPAFLTAY
ncbi:unnamed protein product [Clavelina lepadiformis]|uniref:SMODS and SLOG-associating 2TM effector domain-containing protein n=1 Tax=Clavelina lepadiformis TaxID=159417 RepID=A0ABP0GSB4_CLALP